MSERTFQPRTTRVAADEPVTLPETAWYVNIEREADTYVVHYLDLVDNDADREEIEQMLDVSPEPNTEYDLENE